MNQETMDKLSATMAELSELEDLQVMAKSLIQLHVKVHEVIEARKSVHMDITKLMQEKETINRAFTVVEAAIRMRKENQ